MLVAEKQTGASDANRALQRERLAALHAPYQYTRDDLVEIMTPLEKDDLREILGGDPFLFNFALNHWEFTHSAVELESYPWNVVIPVADLCNASCTFCNSWLRGKRLLKLEELENFREVLPYAAMIGLEGHGEPLIHPNFRQIVTRLKETVDPRCRSYIITNAYHLDDHLDDLIEAGVNVYNISLNAASSAVHQTVMDLGEDGFDRALSSIRRLVALRDSGASRNPIAINCSMVVTADNVAETAAFVRLCNDLKVDLVNLRTLLPVVEPVDGLNYHRLPPYLADDFERHLAEAKAAIAQSAVAVAAEPESWRNPVFPADLEAEYAVTPPKTYTRSEAKSIYKTARGEDLKKWMKVVTRGEKMPEGVRGAVDYGNARRDDRKTGYQCWDIYAILHMNDFFFFVRPCCYLEHTPGYQWTKYDGSYPFMEAWNSPAMVELRRSLRDGPLFNMCTLCPEQKQYPVRAEVPAPVSPGPAKGWARLLLDRIRG